MRPPSADPIVKPQNIIVTSDARRAAGQYSAESVRLVGIAPPSPTPVTNRSQVSVSRSLLSDDASVASPKTIIDATSIALRPCRSASGPTANAPAINPTSPAAKSGPRRATARPHSARIAGAMKPMTAVSKPSMATTRKHSRRRRFCNADRGCVSIRA